MPSPSLSAQVLSSRSRVGPVLIGLAVSAEEAEKSALSAERIANALESQLLQADREVQGALAKEAILRGELAAVPSGLESDPALRAILEEGGPTKAPNLRDILASRPTVHPTSGTGKLSANELANRLQKAAISTDPEGTQEDVSLVALRNMLPGLEASVNIQRESVSAWDAYSARLRVGIKAAMTAAASSARASDDLRACIAALSTPPRALQKSRLQPTSAADVPVATAAAGEEASEGAAANELSPSGGEGIPPSELSSLPNPPVTPLDSPAPAVAEMAAAEEAPEGMSRGPTPIEGVPAVASTQRRGWFAWTHLCCGL
jgi:hypothetical protein